MKKLLLVFIICSACTSNTIYKKPDNLIPKDTMIMLLEDLMIANSASYLKNKNQQTEVNYMPFVFEKFKIDSARFAKSNQYYITVIDDYTKLFETAEKNLSRKKDSLLKIVQLKDSLRKDSIYKMKPKKIEEISKE